MGVLFIVVALMMVVGLGLIAYLDSVGNKRLSRIEKRIEQIISDYEKRISTVEDRMERLELRMVAAEAIAAAVQEK